MRPTTRMLLPGIQWHPDRSSVFRFQAAPTRRPWFLVRYLNLTRRQYTREFRFEFLNAARLDSKVCTTSRRRRQKRIRRRRSKPTRGQAKMQSNFPAPRLEMLWHIASWLGTIYSVENFKMRSGKSETLRR